MAPKYCKMNLQNYTPAPVNLRRLARAYDWFLMTALAIIIYIITETEHYKILHRKSILFCVVSSFYLLIYCPIMDSLYNGTYGKSLAGLKLISTQPIIEKITVLQAYRRILYATWPTLIIIALLIATHLGYDIQIPNVQGQDFYENGDYDEDAPTTTSLFLYLMIFAGLYQAYKLYMNFNAPKYGNRAEAEHDIFANTAVLHPIEKSENQPSFYEIQRAKALHETNYKSD
jgi:hypothetical protein